MHVGLRSPAWKDLVHPARAHDGYSPCSSFATRVRALQGNCASSHELVIYATVSLSDPFNNAVRDGDLREAGADGRSILAMGEIEKLEIHATKTVNESNIHFAIVLC